MAIIIIHHFCCFLKKNFEPCMLLQKKYFKMLTQQFGKPAVRCTLMLLFRMINNCLFKVMNNIKLVIVNNFMNIIFVFIFNVNLLFYGVGHDLCKCKFLFSIYYNCLFKTARKICCFWKKLNRIKKENIISSTWNSVHKS